MFMEVGIVGSQQRTHSLQIEAQAEVSKAVTIDDNYDNRF